MNLYLAKVHRITQGLSVKICESNFQYFSYANITSPGVQGSFSKYKAVLTEKRIHLKENRRGDLMMEAFALFSGTNFTFWLN